MIDQKDNLLHKYAKKVRNYQHFQKILQRQDMTFDYKPFKIDKLTPEKALKTYQGLHHRYNVSKQLALLNDGWHEYEKRLFVWFMVIYSYYLEKETSAMDPQADYKHKINFETISRIFFGKSAIFLQFQYLNLFKVTDKVVWTQREDTLLTNAIKKCPCGKWTQVSIQIFTSSGREKFISSKNCRQRWQNHLDESKVKGNWTLEEDLAIIECVLQRYGKKWSRMKHVLAERRTQHMIKNRYYSLITKHKMHRYDKEGQIALRLLEELRGLKKQAQRQIGSETPKHKTNAQEKIGVELKLKQQNISEQSEQTHQKNAPIPEIKHQNNEVAVKSNKKQSMIKQEAENAKNVGFFDYKLEKAQHLHLKQAEEENDEDAIYPFSNYNYELEICNYNTPQINNQIYQYHKSQMMLYQQYMTYAPAAFSTNDTYIPTIENQGLQNFPEEENPYDD